MRKAAIIGGGITGLTIAHRLAKAGHQPIVFEATARVGGKIRTDRHGGFVVERAPDCFRTGSKEGEALIDELGLSDEVIAPAARHWNIWTTGRLHRVPAGLLRFTSVEASGIDDVQFLSPEGKAAFRNEPMVPPGSGDDESLASFFRRRFGEEFSRTVAETLFAGTHAGNAESLSMRAILPQLSRREQERGCLLQNNPLKPSASVKATDPFLSFRHGMQTIVDALVQALPAGSLCLSTPANSLDPTETGWAIDGESFDDVFLTVPAHAASRLLAPLAPNAAALMHKIKFASSAIATLILDSADAEPFLDGSGFLVPHGERLPIVGATWSSRKWSGRAPSGKELIRVFLPLDANASIDEASLAQTAIRGLSQAVGHPIRPETLQVDIWQEGLPQYQVGHVDLVKEIKMEVLHLGSDGKRSAPVLAGASYEGAGVHSCIEQGCRAAASITEP